MRFFPAVRRARFMLAICAGISLAFGAMATANGALIVQRPLSVNRSNNIFATTQFDLEIVHFDVVTNLGKKTFVNPVNLFEGGVTPADANKTFTLDSGPQFQSVVDRLTDGVDGFIRLKLTERASNRAEVHGFNESGFFAGFSSLPGPDLASADIGSIELRIDYFFLSSAPVLLPVDLAMTFTVQSAAIPEPPSAALAALGLATAAVAAYTVGGKRRRAVAMAAVR